MLYWGISMPVHVSLTCTIFETLTKKSRILVRRKTAPSRAQITTKIYPSATVNKNLSKKQHIKKFCPYKWKSVEKSSKTLVIFQKSSSNWFRVSSQSCTDHKVRSNISFCSDPFPKGNWNTHCHLRPLHFNNKPSWGHGASAYTVQSYFWYQD